MSFDPDYEAFKFGHEWEQKQRAEGRPAIALDFTTAWCRRHLEPFRDDWPRGALVAMLKLFEAFTEDERAQQMTGGDALKIAAIAHECSPLCCFVGDERLKPIYLKLGKVPPA